MYAGGRIRQIRDDVKACRKGEASHQSLCPGIVHKSLHVGTENERAGPSLSVSVAVSKGIRGIYEKVMVRGTDRWKSDSLRDRGDGEGEEVLGRRVIGRRRVIRRRRYFGESRFDGSRGRFDW